MAKQKYYVVWKGKTPGVYHTWTDCQKQVVGFEGAQYLSFENLGDAEVAFTKNPWTYLNKGNASAKKSSASCRKVYTRKPFGGCCLQRKPWSNGVSRGAYPAPRRSIFG